MQGMEMGSRMQHGCSQKDKLEGGRKNKSSGHPLTHCPASFCPFCLCRPPAKSVKCLNFLLL